MKARYLALIFTLGTMPNWALGQRSQHSEAKDSSAPTASHSDSANASSERKPARSSAQALRFQQVAVSLDLSRNQKKSLSSLVQSARQQLSAIHTDASLSPQQRRQAIQDVDSQMAQKFVGMLSPEQKADLTALLLKKKQQQGSNSNSAASSGASPSAPDIPSVDAPSGSDSGDSDNSSPDSSSANAATATATAGNSSATQPATVKAGATSATVAAKNSKLSDAQLAAILNSFVQD